MKPGPKISAVVPTLDEEANLRFLLPTIGWCDEILVVDQGSADGTRDLAREHGARVIEVEWRPDFDACRGLGAERARGDWIFQLDADEMVPPALAERLRDEARRDGVDIVAIPRLNTFQGFLTAGGIWPDYQFRFSRRGSVEFAAEVHNAYKLRSDRVIYLPAREELAIRHFQYRGASGLLQKLDRYTDLELRKEPPDGAAPGLRGFVWTPLRVFLSRYLKQGAFRHGWRGLWLAVFWSFYFFVRAVKSWERRHLPGIREDEERQKREILSRYQRRGER